ncbi:hypothetical protein KIN20_033332 [Parelaphostrongylus tenuis]|uniref:Uncharacterized protein n=1 Tax=Parelaphostrongylus tenuis TaxID=148309 RepID=A0AAD5R8E2_PARTN|nr:hypothetical protein KIN20_033332 [Parelaphostrongylus tenuis]
MRRDDCTNMSSINGDVYAQRARSNRNNGGYPGDFRNNRGYPNESGSQFSNRPEPYVNTFRVDSNYTSAVFRASASRVQADRADIVRQFFGNSSSFDVLMNNDSSSYHSVNGQNGSLRESTLRSDDRASLQIIREYTYLNRNPNTDGYRSLEQVLHLLKVRSANYWIPRIQSHLPEVEIVTFRDKHLLLWRGNDDSD